MGLLEVAHNAMVRSVLHAQSDQTFMASSAMTRTQTIFCFSVREPDTAFSACKAGPFKFFVSRQRPHWFLKNPREQNKPAYIAIQNCVCSSRSPPPAVYVHGRGFVHRTARPASDHEKAVSTHSPTGYTLHTRQ